MKIFVAGATGVIGTELVPMLVASGHDVTGISRSRPGKQQIEAAGARSVEADLFDPGSLNSVLVGREVVINLATSIPPLSRMGDRSAWRLNDRLRTEGAANLAGVAADNSAAIFIQPSVTFLYADGGDQWLDESSPVDPQPVLRSALDAEASAAWFSQHGGKGVVLRLARLYGPGRASAELVNMLRSGGGVIVGDGSNYVSSLHVFDAATAHLAALEIDAGLYNVADDQPTTSLELVSAQTRAVGGPPPQRMPASVAHGQLGEASYMLTISPRVSNRRFKTASGWAPKHPNAIEGSESLL